MGVDPTCCALGLVANLVPVLVDKLAAALAYSYTTDTLSFAVLHLGELVGEAAEAIARV